MILLLTACGGLGFDELSPDGGAVLGAPTITRIKPGWSLPDVETLVTIQGSNFTEPLSVQFGNAEVMDVTVFGDDELVVVAPAAGVEATVDVSVTTPNGTATKDDGFTWSLEPVDTETTTTEDSGGGGGDDQSGKVSGLVEMNYTVYACTACFGITNPLDVSMAAVLHSPKTGSWHGWLPASGDCEEGVSPTSLTSSYLDAGDRLHLETSQVTVTLDADSKNVYSATGLSQSDWQQDAGFDLSGSGGADLDAFSLSDVATTPGGFDSFTPDSLIATSQAQAFTARFSKSGGRVAWSPQGTEDVTVVIDIYSPQGDFQTEWVCRDDDRGSFDIPSKVFNGAASNSLLVIGISRFVIGDTARMDDGSTVESSVTFGVIGTGIVQ